jgi:hypothetical protein
VIFGEGEGEASGFFGMKSSMCIVFMCLKALHLEKFAFPKEAFQ